MEPNDDIPSDETLVKQLIRGQAPEWRELPVRRLASSGTDNALYRLGDRLIVRLPRRRSAISLLRKEIAWLPLFSDLPLEVPRLRFHGYADAAGEQPFAVFDWLVGGVAETELLKEPTRTAIDLAMFLKALQSKGTANAPKAGTSNHHRGVALEDMRANTCAAIEDLADEIDVQKAFELWDVACAQSVPEIPVWLHGDLKADNLLVRDGRLVAVIDWGLCAVGDPAADHAVAWTWVTPEARHAFRRELDLGEGDWLRAQGWALYGAVIALSYYRGGRNEALSQQCRHTLTQLGLLK
ncbi:MAG: aminoglycoside phosphotransferase family protein [Pseudomonadota bacterium]